MTIDKSLKVKAGGSSNRSVLTRVERMEKLAEAGHWASGEAESPYGLPKVRVRKVQAKKKKKKEAEGDEDK